MKITTTKKQAITTLIKKSIGSVELFIFSKNPRKTKEMINIIARIKAKPNL